jgi:hypothetical protein
MIHTRVIQIIIVECPWIKMITMIITGFEGIVIIILMISIIPFISMSFPAKSQMDQQTMLIRIPFLEYVTLH